MARDYKEAMKHTKGLPKFRDVLKMKGTRLKTLGGKASVDVEWDFNKSVKAAQVFKIRMTDGDKSLEALISKQELEHYLRTV